MNKDIIYIDYDVKGFKEDEIEVLEDGITATISAKNALNEYEQTFNINPAYFIESVRYNNEKMIFGMKRKNCEK